jgi:hypothetical protein
MTAPLSNQAGLRSTVPEIADICTIAAPNVGVIWTPMSGCNIQTLGRHKA